MQKQAAPRSLLLIALLIFFTMAIPTGILNVAWTLMQVSYSVSLDSLAILLLAGTCGSLISTFFSGRVIAHIGIGRYLIAGGVSMALGLLCYALTPSWIGLIAAAFVTMIGFSIFNAGLNTFVAANYSTGQLNWLHAAFGVGSTIGPALTTVLVTNLGQSWHLAYGIVFAVMVMVTAALLLTRSHWTLAGDRPTGTDVAHAGIRETLRVPTVLLGMATFFIFSGVLGGTSQLSSPLLMDRGITQAQAGFWISLYWASFTVGRIVMGFVAHRLDNTKLIRACLIGAAAGAFLLLQSASMILNLFGLMLVGLACAPMYPTLIAETRRRVGLRYRANAIGFQIAASGLGQALIPGTMAWFAEHARLNTTPIFPLFGAPTARALT